MERNPCIGPWVEYNTMRLECVVERLRLGGVASADIRRLFEGALTRAEELESEYLQSHPSKGAAENHPYTE